MLRVMRKVLRRLGVDVGRYAPGYFTGTASLAPTAKRSAGRVLLSYIVEPFLLSPGQPVPHAHTHYGESILIADAYRSRGFHVDVVDYRNSSYVPSCDYDIFVSARTNLERIAVHLGSACIKIAHLDTAHYLFNNAAAYARALALQQRRHASCDSIRIVEPNRAIESADYGALLGAEFLRETYAYAAKPMYQLPIPTVATYPWPANKDFAGSRRRFLWFGSSGLVHKGLDLVLEAFAAMPELELFVCGPIEQEPEFVRIYRRELYELPNIRTLGWIDVLSQQFLDITRQCIALVFPSCSESLSASSVTCMQTGLIPLLTREAGVPLGGYGIQVDPSVEGIKRAAYDLQSRSPAELEQRARDSWEYARAVHTKERYREEYTAMVEQILSRA